MHDPSVVILVFFLGGLEIDFDLLSSSVLSTKLSEDYKIAPLAV